METITTSDGHTILFSKSQVCKFFKSTFEQNYSNLSEDERAEFFHINEQYGDLLDKIWREPLQEMLNELYGANWAVQSADRNPTEEYEHHLSIGKDEDLTDEEHQLKMERLRHHKEWFESR
jgi:hypothetical protein